MLPHPSLTFATGLLSSALLAGSTPTLSTPTLQARAVTNTSKAGLAWPNGNSLNINQYDATGKVSWYYTWSAFPVASRLEFSPMLWGQSTINQFTSTIRRTLSNTRLSVTAVLGMNEPELQEQSNMSPEEGAQIWQTHLEPLRALGVRLGSPAPSSSPRGKIWLQDFFAACNGNCNVDFIALHWYGTNSSWFISHLEDYHETFQRPLWVTEWACHNFVDLNAQCSDEEIVGFMNVTQSFMDNAEFVERYAWFGAMKDMNNVNPSNALMNGNGQINPLGIQYINATGWTNLTSNAGRPSITVKSGRSFSSQCLWATFFTLLAIHVCLSL
ncbi:hypothetical protein NLJ89_g4849 [Agrocybe chaxingu]|uniref:Asl1-like glycosyl hydrolase catalytic domain-containing protein n=1 Tax=Agrocybe chaxingu TaxID=84603 RepID=A0A9W8K1B1_9AGAR|nr:hypothetical protein NLJ89_g4849 [Agrocybe chaxingu]